MDPHIFLNNYNHHNLTSAWQNGYFTLPPCPSGNCSNDCSDRHLLFNPSNTTTFFTCWAFPLFADAVGSGGLSSSALSQLADLGIFESQSVISRLVENSIATCLSEHCQFTPGCSTIPDLDLIDNSCAYEAMLSFDGFWSPQTAAICLQNITCIPGFTFNSDIGGIGVFSSFIIQISIAILSYLLFVVLRVPITGSSPLPSSQEESSPGSELVSAFVDFHKTQCYFACAVQIAATEFFRQNVMSSDLSDAQGLLLVSSNSYVPVVFSLFCVMRYARKSWYIIILSLLSWALGTMTLCQMDWFWQTALKTGKVRYNPELDLTFRACGGYGVLSAAWCSAFTANGEPGIVHHGFVDRRIRNILLYMSWQMWAVCTIWLIYCLLWKTTSIGEKPTHRIWWWICCISWLEVFACQLFLYAGMLLVGIDRNNWGFGQIVALMTWLPSITEYINLQKNGLIKGFKWKLPWGFEVIRTRPVNLTCHTPFPTSETHHCCIPIHTEESPAVTLNAYLPTGAEDFPAERHNGLSGFS